ncbi:hypothetical protein BBO99_00004992 [Phytophthora kernoviae]|uniref:FPL domain-containing protein n=2 Tax=Phytophthora kernoviae TaxID=325452 RepID=A0A3R7GJ66_9STRA|nr:hypothetical protein G195_005108 [Phytophthora kernoviae 00238/432]KAG2523993.1 hypothetical protein JM18_004530 [Phytophthora kernoviae]KAG2524368.1 hypothetical protein JM16_005005 [Phytophthora kernoviae]RLN06595.1 hypothetical protein BBI17_005123 [Phytophthora kernoviae]RLN79798.1 hypothetical protein BBO99_00004992 [Phytophthora kernoviae]
MGNNASNPAVVSAPPSSNGARGGFLGAFLSGRRLDFTLANMRQLHTQLTRFAALPDAEIVELLRVLAEFLIYSDQHRVSVELEDQHQAEEGGDPGAFFDYFGETNMLALLVELGASQPSVPVQVQLLQTMSILVQNITTRTSLYYILSNNHVNRLLECPFELDEDDDVRDWYVTLLKALSLRLNEETVQFFLDTQQGEHFSFPLYARALRFGRCNETMVKVAVKTLTLNVLKVSDARVRSFVLQYDDLNYFRDIVEIANDLTLRLQGLLNVWPTSEDETERTMETEKLEETIDAYIDHCFYLQDLLDVNVPELCYKIGDLLFSRHIKRLLATNEHNESVALDDDNRGNIKDGESETNNTTRETSEDDAAAYPYWLVEILLEVLARNQSFRFLSVQLCTRLLMDIMVDTRTPSPHCLVSQHARTLKDIHSSSAHLVMESMRGPMAEVDLFVYVLEMEVTTFQSKNFPMELQLDSSSPFEYLVPLESDNSTSSPAWASAQDTLALRSPSNEIEVCRKAMRVFLSLRKLRELLDPSYVDDKLEHLIMYRHPRTGVLAQAAANSGSYTAPLDGMVSLKCMYRDQRFLLMPTRLLMVLNPEAFVLVERIPDQTDDSSSHSEGEGEGLVKVFAPIHRTYCTMDPRDDRVLQVSVRSVTPVSGCRSAQKERGPSISGTLEDWNVLLMFPTSEDCVQAQAHVNISGTEVRAFKLRQIEESLTAHLQITQSSCSERRESFFANIVAHEGGTAKSSNEESESDEEEADEEEEQEEADMNDQASD